MEVFSPSDYMIAESYVDRTLAIKKPKYIRFDAKPMIVLEETIEDFDNGFRVLQKGKNSIQQKLGQANALDNQQTKQLKQLNS